MIESQVSYNNKLLIIKDFINETDLQNVLNRIKYIYKDSPDSFPFIADGRVGAMCLEDDMIKMFVKKYGSLSINEIKNSKNFPKELYFSDYVTAIYTANGKLDKHNDHSSEYGNQVITTMLYLNDDYEGGEIFFEDLGLIYKPKSGSAVIFPGEYFHEVKPVKSGIRYVIGIGTTTEKDKWLDI